MLNNFVSLSPKHRNCLNKLQIVLCSNCFASCLHCSAKCLNQILDCSSWIKYCLNYNDVCLVDYLRQTEDWSKSNGRKWSTVNVFCFCSFSIRILFYCLNYFCYAVSRYHSTAISHSWFLQYAESHLFLPSIEDENMLLSFRLYLCISWLNKSRKHKFARKSSIGFKWTWQSWLLRKTAFTARVSTDKTSSTNRKRSTYLNC